MLVVPLTLPAIQGALTVLKADANSLSALKEQLDSCPVSTSVQQCTDAIAVDSKADYERVSRVVDFLLLIEHHRRSLPLEPVTIQEYVKIVVRSLEFAVQNLTYTDDELQRFTEFLTYFLNANGALGLSTKANTIITQNERNFLRVRIISEIRPIFEDEEKVSRPIASVICHSLKIEYMESGLRKEFYVALDTGELTELKKAVERAEAKTPELSKILQAANVRFIDIYPEV